MRAKLCVLGLAATITWSLKHHYAGARADDLWWILTPTARAVGVVTGTAFQTLPGEGYVSHERLFVIEKSCAGINFMIAAFVMLLLTSWHHVTSIVAGTRRLIVSLVASYGAAVLVNATRIVVAMWLAAHPLAATTFTAAEVHRLEGIAVYFLGLIVVYEIARRAEVSAVDARPKW